MLRCFLNRFENQGCLEEVTVDGKGKRSMLKLSKASCNGKSESAAFCAA